MNGRKFKYGGLLLLAAVMLTGMERTRIPTSVCTFVASYQAVNNTKAPLGMWEKLVYSFALTKQRSIECKTL